MKNQKTNLNELPILFKSTKFNEVSYLYLNYLLRNRHILEDYNWSSQIQYVHPVSHYVQSKESWKILECCLHELSFGTNTTILNIGSGSGYLERLFRRHSLNIKSCDYKAESGLDGVSVFAPLRYFFGVDLDYMMDSIHVDDFKIYNNVGELKEKFDWIIIARFLNHSYLDGEELDLQHILMCFEKLSNYCNNILISGITEVELLLKLNCSTLNQTSRGQLYGDINQIISELKERIL